MAASYSAVAGGISNGIRQAQDVLSFENDSENSLPAFTDTSVVITRPPGARILSTDIIQSLREGGIETERLECVQRTTMGKFVITFKESSDAREFLALSSMKVKEHRLHIQDINRPISFVNIFDAPQDFSDDLLSHRLKEYGDVISSRRGFFRDDPTLKNGMRHYRIRLKKHIPNFLRFGRLLVFVSYENQPTTCRKCHLVGHVASSCARRSCFNCDATDHLNSECPKPKMCSLCRSEDHVVSLCHFSWEKEEEEIPDDTSEQGSDGGDSFSSIDVDPLLPEEPQQSTDTPEEPQNIAETPEDPSKDGLSGIDLDTPLKAAKSGTSAEAESQEISSQDELIPSQLNSVPPFNPPKRPLSDQSSDDNSKNEIPPTPVPSSPRKSRINAKKQKDVTKKKQRHT